jgi:hypothetical protein
MISITNNKIIILGDTTLARKLSEKLDNTRLGNIEDVRSGDIVISTQGTSRGTARRIIDRCFTDIVEQADRIENIASRFIVIGSVGSGYSSWPGIKNNRMIYNIAKSALDKWAQDHNQKNFNTGTHSTTGMIVQICQPASFQSPMSDYKGLDIIKVVDSIKYLIDNPTTTKIQLRS